ncbi:MAG: hypothetical protein C0417_06385 [Chlorobiaceae bacterium]|nr:hypothetical protein [Chlorobiaceae bacterium]
MKALSAIFILFVFTSSVFAGPDSLFVEIKGDTVKIWNTDVYINCCCSLRVDVSLESDSITIIQVDTAKNWCRCICPFDLFTSINGLTPGTYYVNVYRYLPLGDSTFVGSLSFTIQNVSIPVISYTSYQSNCKEAVEVQGLGQDVRNYVALYQNYPNPFNPNTTIHFELPEESHVTLKIYDMLGREVATLVNDVRKVGSYKVAFDGTKLPGGIYFYKLMSGGFAQTKRLILIK